MNKPAAKEPSMDEILSSIRQIIADDESTPAPPPPRPAPRKPEASDRLPAFDSFEVEDDEEQDPSPEEEQAEPADIEAFADEEEDADDEALALSPDQIVGEDDGEEQSDEESAFDLASEMVIPDDVAFDLEDPQVEPQAQKPRMSVADAAPMPDPNLSADMAEQLLKPTTDAAVRHTFARLGSAALGGQDLTIEKMIREMLRPMLKDWLDENLPTMVERMVEREIERISRGGA